LNTYSIALLIACEFINCLGNLWVYYVCINFGILENLLSLLKGSAILLLAAPLCLDLCYTLLQKVNPSPLADLLEDKMRSLAYLEGVISVRKWHLWCLDKSYRIVTVHIDAREEADADEVRRQVEKKLRAKWCESLTVHVTQ
jgi:Co/Zn/Cd efflux system component